MHIDMAGSAAVLAVMQALPQLGYAGNVVGVLALAENAVGPDSYKPLAVLPSAAGSGSRMCDTAPGAASNSGGESESDSKHEGNCRRHSPPRAEETTGRMSNGTVVQREAQPAPNGHAQRQQMQRMHWHTDL